MSGQDQTKKNLDITFFDNLDDISNPDLIGDLVNPEISDNEVMDKHRLDHRQLVYVLSRLAEKRKISFSRVFGVVSGYLHLGDLERAEDCLGVIRENFSHLWGIQALAQGLEQVLVGKKSRVAKIVNVKRQSESLARFLSEHPRIPLHPVIDSLAASLDFFSEQIRSHGAIEKRFLPLIQSPFRLELVEKNLHLFTGLNTRDARHLWHMLALELFYHQGVPHYRIMGVMDPDICDVCMYLSHTKLPVAQVRQGMAEKFKNRRFSLKTGYPRPMDVDNLAESEKLRVLLQNDWCLPPFCDDCRCQILPCN